MCGIVGEMKYGLLTAHGIGALSRVERANQRQYHRGPDSYGLYQLGNLTLGHTRLKIYDLSDKAAQPLFDHELGLALVFNGAIYNFHKLKQELQAIGYRFVSNSDTEVILKAYHAWGIASISRLQGMFAFAIWERQSSKLVLARDRLGIKPLYYSATNDSFRFASTLPALLEFDNIDTSINSLALQYYLTFHAVPEPLTILKGIQKLAPGNIISIHINGRIEQHSYWQLHFNDDYADHRDIDNLWITSTYKTLHQVIKKQFTADVPIGILLSGGIDSSLIVAIASSITKQKIKTFSIGFESTEKEKGDEFYYSDIVAGKFNTQHQKIFINNNQLIDSLDECVKSMSEPMPSHDNIGFFLLAKEVAKQVKVVLSGQGADEIFAGYHWIQKFANLSNTKNSFDIYRANVFDMNYQEYCKTVTEKWRIDDYASTYILNAFKNNGSSTFVDNALQVDATFALSNGPLGRVDNMTMASSLEARVPFLDEELIELASIMPLKYKLANGGKNILKQLGKKLLPHEVVCRPKGYFPVPALKCLQSPIKNLLNDILSPQQINKRGIFNSAVIKDLLSNSAGTLTPFGASKLWQIGLLEYWLQKQGL